MKLKLTDIQQATLDIIKTRGKHNPITGANLTDQVGVKDDVKTPGANMRSVIHALRMKGLPICANSQGYWWPTTSQELSAYIVEFQARINEQQKACDALRKGFGVFETTVVTDGPLTITTEPGKEPKVECVCSLYAQIGRCNHTDAYGTA